ncbi:hypothetical protein ABBQ38_010757 [Trebouxia sp. C0009 RCD-2024]
MPCMMFADMCVQWKFVWARDATVTLSTSTTQRRHGYCWASLEKNVITNEFTQLRSCPWIRKRPSHTQVGQLATRFRRTTWESVLVLAPVPLKVTAYFRSASLVVAA